MKRRNTRKNADDLVNRDAVFRIIGGRGWYGTEGELRALLEKDFGGLIDEPRKILRLLQGWDDARRTRPKLRREGGGVVGESP